MRRTFNLLFTMVCVLGTTFSQTNFIYQEVVQAQKNRGITQVLDLDIRQNQIIKSDEKSNVNQVSLKFSGKDLTKLITNKSNYIELQVPGLSGEELNLQLVKADIHAPGFKLIVDDPNARYEIPYDYSQSAFYRGIVNGERNSLVSLSFFEGEISGYINSDLSGSLGIKKSGDTHILSDLSDLSHQSLECGTLDDGGGYSEEMLKAPSNNKAVGDYVAVFIEVEGDMTEWQGGVSQVTNYMQGLFNESATIYAGDGVDTRISTLEINTTEEYSSRRGRRTVKPSGSSAYLSAFQSAKSSSFDGDLAHLVAFNNVGGVAAGFSGICNSDRRQSMCISGFVTDYWFNLQIFAHEMGHLMGSRHTHACVWNGNNTAIDGCAGGTEGTCATPPPAAQNEGTIMSYCYNNYGLDFNEGFHPQPSAVIQNTIANATCLQSGGGGTGPSCFDGIQNGDETDVDCGGSCAPCPTCNDGIQNGDETGVDCGGSCPTTCPPVSCDDPTGLQVTNMRNRKGTGNAQLRWNDVTGASTYDVRIRTAGSSVWSDFPGVTSPLALEGFVSGDYEWEVRANCTGGSSNYVGCTFTYVNRGSNVTCGTASPVAGYIPAEMSEEVLVYPNPVHSILRIEVDNASSDNYKVEVYNAVGQLVYANVMNSDSPVISLNVSEYNAGLYMVSVASESLKTVTKVLVE